MVGCKDKIPYRVNEISDGSFAIDLWTCFLARQQYKRPYSPPLTDRPLCFPGRKKNMQTYKQDLNSDILMFIKISKCLFVTCFPYFPMKRKLVRLSFIYH